jgi:hypothetical protein
MIKKTIVNHCNKRKGGWLIVGQNSRMQVLLYRFPDFLIVVESKELNHRRLVEIFSFATHAMFCSVCQINSSGGRQSSFCKMKYSLLCITRHVVLFQDKGRGKRDEKNYKVARTGTPAEEEGELRTMNGI